jgi:hypothetical protein
MAADKIEPILARLRQLGHGGSAGDYKVFKREDGKWVLHYKDLTVLEAGSKPALQQAVVAYHRGYWQAYINADLRRCSYGGQPTHVDARPE